MTANGMKWIAAWLMVCCAHGFAAPAMANDWDACFDTEEADLALSGCTAIIDAGKEPRDRMATALYRFEPGQL
jgi:hypothetical protein